MNVAENLHRDSSQTTVYYQNVIPHIPRLISYLDRELHSLTYGSFDRDHWSWKFRDFPINMLQVSVYPLALVWSIPFPNNGYYQNTQLLKWIEAALLHTTRRQHANGAFDSVGPNTQDYGVTLAMVYCMTEALRLLEGCLSEKVVDAVTGSVISGCNFAFQHGEDYAFITNHQALFALAYLNAYRLTEKETYLAQSRAIIQDIIDHQSSDGWYQEYEGPDPGYESLGLFYLAMYWKRTGDNRLFDSLQRSLEFYAHCVHPDGSVGGNYGSRHTALYYPGGFEILAEESSLAAKIAGFMRERLHRQNVVLPGTSDFENLPSLAYIYLEAHVHYIPEQADGSARLPCESLSGVHTFPESRIAFIGSPSYYAVISASKGGVCRIFDKRTGFLVYQDDGYILDAVDRRWSSQFIGLGRWEELPSVDSCVCETRFVQITQEVLTPAKFIVLRLLNLTVFRSLALGGWIRNRIIARLITHKLPGPIRLTRRIVFLEDELRIQDRIVLERPIKIESLSLPRSFTAIHMGSAKYYCSSDLLSMPELSQDDFISQLNHSRFAEREIKLDFPEQDLLQATNVAAVTH